MDTLGNLLSNLKNASMVNKPFVELPYSIISERVLMILKDAGFISGVKLFKLKDSVVKMIRVDLNTNNSRISVARRVSKPGRRIYRSFEDLKPVRNGFGVGIVSTSSGLMTTLEAKKRHLGGELICEVY